MDWRDPYVDFWIYFSALQIPATSSSPNSNLSLLNLSRLQCFAWVLSLYIAFWQVLSSRKLGCPRVHFICFPALGDHSSALPVIHCLKSVVSCILSSFLVWYGGRECSIPVQVKVSILHPGFLPSFNHLKYILVSKCKNEMKSTLG